MNAEEIRQKAIECGRAFETMCESMDSETDEEYNTICHCEYNVVPNDVSCSAVYGYEHGFADGVEEGEKQMSGIIIRNVIESLEEVKNGDCTLDEYIIQLYEQVIQQMKGE